MNQDHLFDPGWVPRDAACPTCQTFQQALLIWIDDATVRCTVCGEQFQPLAQEQDDE